MTAPPNASSTTSRRPWWNFSLRELLLLMVAVGACFALFRKEYYSRQLSPIVREKKLYELIQKVIHENRGNTRTPILKCGCSGPIGTAGDGVGENVSDYYLAPKLSLPTTFMRILRDAVQEEIVENGGHINSSGANYPEHFRFDYRYLNNVGVVTVIFVPGNATSGSRIYFTCFEVSRSAN